MESQRPYLREDGAVWLLPEIKNNISEPVLVLEMRNPLRMDVNGDDTDFHPSHPQYVFSLPSEPSIVTAVIQGDIQVSKEDGVPRKFVARLQVFYRDSDNIRACRAAQEIESMEKEDRPMLIEQEHGPNKDLNLLTAAYLSMNTNISDSNRDFIVHDNAIYKQCTLLGNTVLHLAAIYGNNTMVEKVAQHAPYLFTATNENNDTALHVAARAGHASTVQFLLNAFFYIVRRETKAQNHRSILEMMLMVSLTLLRNNQGNTFFHEAFIVNGHNGAMIFQAFEASFIRDSLEFETDFKAIVDNLAPFAINKEGKSLLYLAIEFGCNQIVNRLMDICVEHNLKPQGKSPLLPAVINKKIDMLEIVLSKKPNWRHLRNEEGRFPLHYAASMGYLEGVSYLIKKCASCIIERDNDGFFPIHLACNEGHIKVVQELLKWCPDATEMLHQNGQNFLHIAAKSGKYKVVRYILQHPKLEKMINQKDKNGDTPLHLATIHWHPKIVLALTWDNRVNLGLLNQQNQTALDIADQTHHQNTTLAQRLTWSALQAAGTPRSSMRFHSNGTETSGEKEAPPNTELYKDRIDTLIVVSTLIITASFAAGFTMPGDIDQGTAVMLNHHMFHLFIFSITISIFGAISSTIILMWTRLGDLSLTLFALKCAMPLLGTSLTTLYMAFLAAVYLVINKLNWLATSFLVIGVILILMVVFLYTLLWLPSSSTSLFIRYISYYPFLGLATLAEGDTQANHKGYTSSSSPKLTETSGFFELTY